MYPPIFSRPTMDASFVSLLDRNLFKNLKSLCLYGGCFLSLGVLRRLVLSSACPNLSSLSFLQFLDIETADVEALRSAATSENLDIKICCLELGWTE